MAALTNILLVTGISTLLALWCGWGLARLTLPASLKPWSGLLAPLLGYALVLVVGYWGVRDWVGLPVVLLVLLPAMGLVNAVAWRRTGPPRLPKKPLLHVPLGALLLATLFVGVAPLISYGHPAIIGEGWDVENYLPVARYLERGPISAIANAAPNPLRDLNAHPPSKGLTLGFSIWQGSVDLLTGQEAITTFAPLLAWLRMLGIVAVYVLFRAIMGLTRPFALLSAGFVSAGGLLLWVEYFNFGMQISAWPLIPLGLIVGVEAVKDIAMRGKESWPVIAGAAISLAALPVAYYPALTLFAPLAVGLGAVALLQAKRRTRLLLGAAALAGVTLLLSVPSVLAYNQGFSDRYEGQLTSLGLFRYVPLTDFAGLTTFSLRGDPPVPDPSLVAFSSLCALMLVGLALGQKRVYWVGLTLGGAAYMLWLWGQQYPYAWMKGGAYAAFPFLGLAAAGVQALFIGRRITDNGRRTDDENTQYEIRSTGHASRITYHAVRWAAIILAIALLTIMGVTQSQTVADHCEQPRLFARELPAMLDLRSQVPRGSRVTLTSDPRIMGVTTALAAYMLDHTTLLGSASTGYVPRWSNGQPDEIGDYALLLAGEDPQAIGFGYGQAVWQGGGFTLYKGSPNTVAHLQLDRTLNPGDTFNLPFDDKRLGAGATQGGSHSPRTVMLMLAAFDPGELTVDGAPYRVPTGGSLLLAEKISTPHLLTLRNSSTTPVMLRWATLTTLYDVTQTAIDPQPGVVLVQAQAQADGTRVTTAIDVVTPHIGPITVALDVWDHKRNLHYGWYGTEQPHAEARRTFSLTLDLETGKMEGKDSEGVPVFVGGGPEGLRPGDYTASLNVLAGTQLLAAPEDVFGFSVDGAGKVSNVRAATTPPVAARAHPATPLSLLGTEEGEVQLLGYSLSDNVAHPGGEALITLWWTSGGAKLDERSILLHLRDSKGEKRAQADGPPAGGGRPTTTWQPGETIIDKHTLKIPADLPPGSYTIAVGMYHYPSLEPVPLRQVGETKDGVFQPAKPIEGNVFLIPFEIEP